jgi:hypothetical protein
LIIYVDFFISQRNTESGHVSVSDSKITPVSAHALHTIWLALI